MTQIEQADREAAAEFVFSRDNFRPDAANRSRWEEIGEAAPIVQAFAAHAAPLRATIAALRERVKELEGVGETLRKEAHLLLQNSEGCALNHYGDDGHLHGMPGWLMDSRQRIEAAAQALKEPGHG